MATIVKGDNYILKFILTAFWGARVQAVEDEDGNMEECVCIPLDRNNLKKNKRGQVTSYFFMTESQVPNMYGWTHYLKPKHDPNFLKHQNELGYNNFYAGNAKKGNYIIHKKEYQQKLVKANDYE